jgi:nicotinic acid phosphoribosyltransferase
MRGLRFVKPDFADFLGLFHLDRKYIQLRASTAVPGEIELDITGPWLHTILFEVPLLAIINEVWFRNTTTADFAEGERRLQAKAALLRDTPVSSTAASPTTAAAAATRVTGTRACCRCCATRSARSWSAPATCTSRACMA